MQRAITRTGRNLHADDPIELWDAAAKRLRRCARRRGDATHPDWSLTGTTLRSQTMHADQIIAEIIADEQSTADVDCRECERCGGRLSMQNPHRVCDTCRLLP